MARRAFLLIALGTVVVAALYLTCPQLRVGLHFALTQLCHGTSSGKILFVLGFVAVFMLRLSAWRAGEPAPSRAWDRALALAVAVGLGACLGSWVLYTIRFDLPTNWHTFHWRAGVNSVNCATHIHTGKVAIAWLVELLGRPTWHQHFDTGAAYLQAVPVWLAGVIGACFVTAVVAGLVAGGCWVARYPERQQPGVAVLAALALSSLAKCIVDGGPLAYDAIAAVLFVVLIARARSLDEVGRYAYRYRFALGLSIALWLSLVAAVDVRFVEHQLQQFLYRSGWYTILLLIGGRYAGRDASRPAHALVPRTVAAATVVWLLLAGRTTLWPLFQPASAEAVVYDYHRDGTARTVTDAADPIAATLVALPETASYLAAYEQLGANPLRTRNVSVRRGAPGCATSLWAEVVVLDIDQSTVEFAPSPLIRLQHVETSSIGRYPRLQMEVRFSPDLGPVLWRGTGVRQDQIDENERFVAYYLLDAYLRAGGIGEYILLPLGQTACE